MLRGNQDLLRNAGSLAATTGVTSILGFAYWIFAARFYPTEVVGYGSAAVSTMMLLGAIGEAGIGTMLIGELPRGRHGGELITASLIASFVVSFVLGLGFALISIGFGKHFVEISGSVGRIAVFSLGVAVIGLTTVFDEVTIGLMRGGLQLRRNITVSIAKMAVLPAAALVFHDHFGFGIMFAWVVGTFFSLIPTALTIKRGGGRLLYRPDWKTLWQLRMVVLSHNSLNLAITTPVKLIPVLVAIVVSPSANGAYYIALMISSFLAMVPINLSTVLFAVASAAPEKIGEKLRFVLRTSLYIGIPAGLVMGLCAHLVLSVFGSSYAALATGPLWILIVGYIPGLPNSVYIAVARATGQINKAAVFFTVFLALRIAALVVFGKLGGLYGLSWGMFAVTIVQAFFTTPPVLRIAYRSVPVRRSAGPVTDSQVRLHTAEHPAEMLRRQEAGLAALISLSTAVSPSRHPAATAPQARLTSATPRSHSARGRHPRPTVLAAAAEPYPADSSWWPDEDEETFRNRQESGMEALIAVATHGARF
jgi:O-antigen/teichoic acid export membrane protein